MIPESPTPRLTGLGINVHLPGYETPLPGPNAIRTWLLDEDVVVDLIPGGLMYEIRTPDVVAYVTADEMVRAASGVANLLKAKIHGARAVAAAVPQIETVEEALAAMLARGLGVAA